jgi:hypothetical protein
VSYYGSPRISVILHGWVAVKSELVPLIVANVDFNDYFTLPAFCNRDDHLVRTLVAARCSALYFLTNFVSSVALGNQSVF